MSTSASSEPKTGTTGAWVLLSCSIQVLITTTHHVHGALIYETPGRYHAVLIALAALALAAAAHGVTSTTRDNRRVEQIAWWASWSVSLLGFVIAFGVIEGLCTHVLMPLLSGYDTPGEPFDLFFQTTGVLHVPSALITALLLTRALRVRRGRRPGDIGSAH